VPLQSILNLEYTLHKTLAQMAFYRCQQEQQVAAAGLNTGESHQKRFPGRKMDLDPRHHPGWQKSQA